MRVLRPLECVSGAEWKARHAESLDGGLKS